MHAGDLPLQTVVILQEPAQKRQKLRACGGGRYTAAAPFQQRHAPFLFQIGHHFADGGLGVIQFLGGVGKAAPFHRFDKGKIFQQGVFHSSIIPLLDVAHL